MAVYNKVSEQRLDEEQHQQTAGEVRNSLGSGRCRAHTDENDDTVVSLLLSQEDKPQIQEKSYVRWGIHLIQSSVSQIIHKELHLRCYKKSALNSWLKRTAFTRYFWYAVLETIRDNKQTYMKNETYKLYSGVF